MIKNDVRGRQTDFHLRGRKNFHRPPKNPTQALCFPNGPLCRLVKTNSFYLIPARCTIQYLVSGVLICNIVLNLKKTRCYCATDLSDALTILKQLLLEPWESQYLINKPFFQQRR